MPVNARAVVRQEAGKQRSTATVISKEFCYQGSYCSARGKTAQLVDSEGHSESTSPSFSGSL
jgi:hypothetical protein